MAGGGGGFTNRVRDAIEGEVRGQNGEKGTLKDDLYGYCALLYCTNNSPRTHGSSIVQRQGRWSWLMGTASSSSTRTSERALLSSSRRPVNAATCEERSVSGPGVRDITVVDARCLCFCMVEGVNHPKHDFDTAGLVVSCIIHTARELTSAASPRME